MVGARMSRRARRHFKKIQRADTKYALQEIATDVDITGSLQTVLTRNTPFRKLQVAFKPTLTSAC